MNIKTKIISVFTSAIIALGANASAAKNFLCMRLNETLAVTADENLNFQYTRLRDSNGLLVYPQISSDGNTYLPLRFICEQSGLSDAFGLPGELPEEHFRYLGATEGYDRPMIELRSGGNYAAHFINEPFQYDAAPGDVRTVCIYNIRGILYAPAAYLAKITGCRIIWQGDFGQIMYLARDAALEDFLYSKNMLRRDKQLVLEFDYFCNNLSGSPLYLKTSGTEIGNLSAELGRPVKSVTRSGRKLYFIDTAGKICTKTEDQDDTSYLSFFDTSGAPVEITAADAMIIRDKLYGISVQSPSETAGRLFLCDLDGRNLKYLTDTPVYNLQLKKNMQDDYLFYGDAATRANIYMIPLTSMDRYTIEITSFSRENMLADMKQFIVGRRTVAYIDGSNRIHIITLKRPLEKLETARLEEERHQILTWSAEGDVLSDPLSLNYDYLNDVIYLASRHGRIYYYTNQSQTFRQLHTYPEPIESFSLFSTLDYSDINAALAGNRLYPTKTCYQDDTVQPIS